MEATILTPDQQAATLLARDFLYDDPGSYRAGVLEALRLLAPAGGLPAHATA